ncbi:MAG: citrate lyase subunit alpha, partial [Prevotella sp.]|nr:citrate lyase subunit alpha [Prevotella sp.]
MNSIKERAALIQEAAKKLNKEIYQDSGQSKNVAPRTNGLTNSHKVVSLEEAIRRSGLQNGMTISFHHHFRAGDKVINMVVDKLAEMGYKDLHLASSSLIDVHEPLIEHIRNGVITRISTSGLRGKLAQEISHGLMKEPVIFRSHGSRGSAIA